MTEHRIKSGDNCICCILTLDQAVNQRSSAQDATVKISGSSHVVEQKCVGVMKWYMQMTTWDMSNVIVSSESVSACGHGSSSEWLGAPLGQRPTEQHTAGLQLSTPGQETKEVSSGAFKITQHGIVKRSYGSIWQAVFVSLHLSVSHTPQKLYFKKE